MLDGLVEVAQKTVEGEPTILHVALPTGYGKSTASLLIANILSGKISEWKELNDYAERVIHTVPTRYLVEQLVERSRNQNVKAYGQAMFLDPTLRSPFFISRLVFTTIDSYVLNFFKIPIEEIKLIATGYSRGHFDTPRYAIMSAINVFDEYHLLTPGDSAIREIGPYMNKAWTTFQVILYQLLTNYKCPIILETATPRQEILTNLPNTKILNIGLTANRSHEQENKWAVYDECFKEKLLEAKYHTKIFIGDFVDIINREVSYLEKPILIACNTIEEALKVYDSLKNNESDVTLLHSQFTLIDRIRKIKNIEEKIDKKSDFILIATQVVEVGVDLNFASLITNAAPLASLAQRVGRVNRKLDPSSIHKIIVVYDENSLYKGSYSGVYNVDLVHETIEEIKRNIERFGENNIGWRMTFLEEKVNNMITLTGLSKCIYGKLAKINVDHQWEVVLKSLLNIFIEAEGAIELLKKYGGFIREDLIAPLYVLEEEHSEEGPIEFNINRLVPCKASKLGLEQDNIDLRRGKEVLVFKGDEILIIIEDKNGYRKVWADPKKVVEGLIFGIINIVEEKEKTVFLHALCANPNHYNPREGLLI